MQRVLLLPIVLMVAGCVDPEPIPSTPLEAATSASPTTSNLTAPASAVEVTVALEAPESTRLESTRLFVNTTAPLDVTVTQAGRTVVDESIAASRTWTLPLALGRNEFVASASAPGISKQFPLEVSRLAKTSLSVDFGVFHPSSQGTPRSESFEVWIDVDSRPSADAYAKEGIANADVFTAHDQLVVFMETTGTEVVFEYFPSFQGFGVSRIDGAGSPVSSDAPPWWCYTVNDGSADGISIQPVAPGDAIAWELGSCS